MERGISSTSTLPQDHLYAKESCGCLASRHGARRCHRIPPSTQVHNENDTSRSSTYRSSSPPPSSPRPQRSSTTQQSVASRAQLLHLFHVPVVLRAGEPRTADAEGDGRLARGDPRDAQEMTDDSSGLSLMYWLPMYLSGLSFGGGGGQVDSQAGERAGRGACIVLQ